MACESEASPDPHPAAGHALAWILERDDLEILRGIWKIAARDDPDSIQPPNEAAKAALATLDKLLSGNMLEPTAEEILGLAWIIITKGEGTIW